MKPFYKNRMRLGAWIVALIAIVLVYSVDVEAGSERRRGQAGATELLVPVEARGLALGSSFQAISTGIAAASWNPAGVDGSDYDTGVLFSTLNYIAGINFTYAGISRRMGRFGSFGATLRSVNFGEIDVTTENNPDGTGETFSPSYITLGAVYSNTLTDRIRVGAQFKLISEKIMRESATGMAFDAGVQYTTGPNGVSMGVTLKNLGSNMQFNGPDIEQFHQPSSTEPGTPEEPLRPVLQDFDLPSSLHISVGYNVMSTGAASVDVLGGFTNHNYSYDEYSLGAEAKFIDGMIALRGAYQLASDPEANNFFNSFVTSGENYNYLWGPSFGGGLNLELGTMNLLVDYGYRLSKLFNGMNMFTFTLTM